MFTDYAAPFSKFLNWEKYFTDMKNLQVFYVISAFSLNPLNFFAHFFAKTDFKLIVDGIVFSVRIEQRLSGVLLGI